ncbi:MAG: hypothetical protein RSA99_04680 [Oscillospiraceae bacterium]
MKFKLPPCQSPIKSQTISKFAELIKTDFFVVCGLPLCGLPLSGLPLCGLPLCGLWERVMEVSGR